MRGDRSRGEGLRIPPEKPAPRPLLEALTMRDPYDVLGLAPTATADAIKAAYRKAAQRYHPDRNPAASAVASFRAVQLAYELLSDEGKRRDYDALRQRNLIDDPLQEATSLWSSYLEKVIS